MPAFDKPAPNETPAADYEIKEPYITGVENEAFELPKGLKDETRFWWDLFIFCFLFIYGPNYVHIS